MDMVDYSPVPQIVEDLLAEGLHPSADRVRQRLGRGSNETIGKLIKVRLRELGKLPQEDEGGETRQALSIPADRLPTPEPLAVRRRLDALRLETATLLATAAAEAFLSRQHQRPPEPRQDPGAGQHWHAMTELYRRQRGELDGPDAA